MLRKVPDATESFADRAPSLLADRHHGVLLAGMVLLLELCHLDPNLVPTYRKQARSWDRIRAPPTRSGVSIPSYVTCDAGLPISCRSC